MTVYYQPGSTPDNIRGNSCRSRNRNCDNRIDCSPDKVVFGCRNISGVSGLSVIAIGDTLVPRTVGTISVPDLDCFDRPCVKLDFSAVISFSSAIALGTTITFRVFKRCGGGEEMEIQSFDFNQGLALITGTSIPVAFSICDCDGGCFEGCCIYRITVEATALVAVGSAININQGTISALGTDMC